MTSQLVHLAQRALELVKPSRSDPIKKVTIGVLYSAIELQSGTVGVSFTLTDRGKEQEGYHSLLRRGFLSEKTLEDLIEYCSSSYAICRTIGVAALNTHCQGHIDYSTASDKDGLEILDQTPDEIIGMVGNIHPISRYLGKKGVRMRILDKFMSFSGSTNIARVNQVSDLKGVDHIFISGSALVFENFDEIIALLPNIMGSKILIGPSAQIFPKLAFELGFSAVGSSRIVSPNEVMRIIQEGGGYRFFKSYTEKYLFKG